jgi:hypothetical protein
MKKIIITALIGLLVGILLAAIPILYVWIKNDGPRKRAEAIQKIETPAKKPGTPATESHD